MSHSLPEKATRNRGPYKLIWFGIFFRCFILSDQGTSVILIILRSNPILSIEKIWVPFNYLIQDSFAAQLYQNLLSTCNILIIKIRNPNLFKCIWGTFISEIRIILESIQVLYVTFSPIFPSCAVPKTRIIPLDLGFLVPGEPW